jgi:hypothetical protein
MKMELHPLRYLGSLPFDEARIECRVCGFKVKLQCCTVPVCSPYLNNYPMAETQTQPEIHFAPRRHTDVEAIISEK